MNDDPLRSDDAPVARVFDQASDAVLDDRGESHGDIHDNFTQIADLWGDYLGVHVDPVDVAVMNVLQKISRSDAGSRKEDHFVDMAGYAAIANGLARSMPDEDCENKAATDGGQTPPHETDGSPWDWQVRTLTATNLYDDAMREWGADAQAAKASEECAELAAVLSRDLNGQASLGELIQEIVDVRIMLEQLVLTFGLSQTDLEEEVTDRLQHLDGRLNGGGSDE